MQIVLDVGSFAMALTAVAAAVYGAGRALLRGADRVVERHTGPIDRRLGRVEGRLDRIERNQTDGKDPR